jgi:3-methyladenine DNA glycosylase AlkD
MNMTADTLMKELRRAGDKEKGIFLLRFFKTGKGQYGEGDLFLGITVPVQRLIAKKYVHLKLTEIVPLMTSQFHEFRLCALMILDFKYEAASKLKDEKTKQSEQKRIFDFYIKHKKYINNWDLVDTSARDIVGAYLFDKPRDILYKLAVSTSLWDRRIAIIATHYFIKKGQYEDTIKISEMLLGDREDLMHKAVGWMLREMGNKSEKHLINFLDVYAAQMPRTMLRYSLERLSPQDRKTYMSVKGPKLTK